jgi:ABC-type transport system involved in multi-copper enzyme maturation permease subunit
VTVALIGGNAIAVERFDRSAEFLFSLPITRRRILASKLLLALGIIVVNWLINAPIIWCLEQTAGLYLNSDPVMWWFANIAITGATFFGVAWGLSSFLASPASAVLGGLLAPLFVLIGIPFAPHLFWGLGHLRVCLVESSYCITCLLLAPLGFILGTLHYLRRVEP